MMVSTTLPAAGRVRIRLKPQPPLKIIEFTILGTQKMQMCIPLTPLARLSQPAPYLRKVLLPYR